MVLNDVVITVNVSVVDVFVENDFAWFDFWLKLRFFSALFRKDLWCVESRKVS